MKNPTVFRQAIGCLQYLINIRPDITFAINKLSQFLSSPTDAHWKAVKRIFRYLKGTTSLALHIKPATHFSLQGFSDADWAVYPDDLRSVGGYCVFLGESLLSWSAKKQPIVVRSSAELKYRSLANLATELAWVQSLFIEIGLHLRNPPVAWCDNMSVAALASNPILHARSKHIEFDVHYIRDRIQNHQRALSPFHRSSC